MSCVSLDNPPSSSTSRRSTCTCSNSWESDMCGFTDNKCTTIRASVRNVGFIGRMVQHTMPKGLKRIRYYGVQATKTFTKVNVMIQAALANVEGVVKGAIKIVARLPYRQRYEQS